MTHRHLVPRLLPLVLLGLSAIATGTAHAQPCGPQQPSCQLTTRRFRIHAYSGTIVRNGGKCLDYAAEVAGSPIFLNDCSVAHPFDVAELDVPDEGNPGHAIRNHVLLFAGSKVVGVRRPTIDTIGLGGPPTSPAPTEPSLELQNRAGTGKPIGALGPSPADQVFALDGDSIMLANNRRLVAKVKNGRGANGTPIVIGPRTLEESELWDFRTTDGSDDLPTAGFIRVTATLQALSEYLGPAAPRPDFGTVFVLREEPIILLSAPVVAAAAPGVQFDTMVVPAGVTIRGDRRGPKAGPELFMLPGSQGTMFQIDGNDARITGLRLRGPSRSLDELPGAKGILVTKDYLPAHIDHNDMSDWTDAAAGVAGLGDSEMCEMPPEFPDKIDNVVITRNFIHDNQRENLGYGIVFGGGGTGSAWGNTFVRNRHAIAADGTARTGYVAWFNLVLSDAPTYGFWGTAEHDFDMHGHVDDPDDTHHYGGRGGNYVSIAWNTFLGDNRYNYALRGEPCGTNYFSRNVSMRDRDDAVYNHYSSVETSACPGGYPYYPNGTLSVCDNQFRDSSPGYSNPTEHLGVGDFDGDGRQDLFLATGTAWFFAPAGKAEWRLLAGGRTDRIDDLLFGDFDGDGRTDVVGKNDIDIMVSWGGASEWEVLNSLGAPITDLASGNFDGGPADDLFFADGQSWYLASGGSGPFVFRNTSSLRVSDLRFGDFNDNGKTDAFGIVSDWWQLSDGASTKWLPLQPKLTSTVDDLVIADFDGDHRDDVAIEEAFGLATWKFSPAGLGTWLQLTGFDGDVAAIGRFLGQDAANMLGWDGRSLVITSFQTSQALYSTQDMR